ncbi:MAG TPA: secretin N-terminal domain-containing protein [Candidatus Baltobacteraceae bacterium]|nr:secretin N-terminal domain-containing protein [Candidatus Baltobacteraceae bacterium]
MRRSASALALLLLCSVPAVARDARFSIEARDVELADVIRLIGAQSGRNVVPDGSVKEQRVSLRLRGVTFDEALATVAAAYGLQTHADGRVVIVGDAASMSRRFGDDRAAGGTRTAVFALRHARPDDLLPSLQTALPAGTVIVGDKRTASLVVTANDAALARARALVAALDAPAGDASATDTFALRNVRASEALRLLKGAVPEGALVADDRRNAVAITGSAEMRASARRLLASVDAPGRQVMFEVRVADVQPIDDSTNVGLQLGGAGFGTGALGQFPYTLTARSVTVNAQLDTLIQHGHASILAQPRIATLNNREASLLVGEQYPVVTVNQQTGFPTVQTIDVGVRLRVTPTIGEDGEITAELHPEYSQIIGFNDSFPIIANRKLDSALRVHDGETIVLGGLFEDVDSETVTKFPLLGDLPILGAVFRNRQRNRNKDEVVFFITPRLLADRPASASPGGTAGGPR